VGFEAVRHALAITVLSNFACIAQASVNLSLLGGRLRKRNSARPRLWWLNLNRNCTLRGYLPYLIGLFIE